MRSICVYCGSSKGKNPKFVNLAQELGQTLASREISLVYGGGQIGLMGEVADACLSNGGEVTGIIPEFLGSKEIAHQGLTKLIRVDSMHSRKLKMSQMSDGFIALPGGYGTLEELCETLTWVQLSLVNKPVGILNIDGFYDHFFSLLDKMVEEELLKETNLRFFVSSTSVSELLSQMEKLSNEVTSLKDKFIHT